MTPTFQEIARDRNRLDRYSDREERFRDAVMKAWDRGYNAEEIRLMCGRPRPGVGRILTIVRELGDGELEEV